MQILIIEDEVNVASMIRTCVESDGHIGHVAHSGAQGLLAFQTHQPDVVLLDLRMPGMDGLEVCTRIRQSKSAKDPYIMMLTAKADEMDRIIGFSTGVDDYPAKPFSPRELLVRIRALLRREMRQQEAECDRITTPHFNIDISKREVWAQWETEQPQAASLSAVEFDLLVTLAKSSGRVWTRTQLLDQVWGTDYFGDERIVDSYIKRIRKKLSFDQKRPSFIRTVSGVGYSFNDLQDAA
jgi:two-component system OmpR family response regulator